MNLGMRLSMLVAVGAGVQQLENMQKEFMPGMFRSYMSLRFPYRSRRVQDASVHSFTHHCRFVLQREVGPKP